MCSEVGKVLHHESVPEVGLALESKELLENCTCTLVKGDYVVATLKEKVESALDALMADSSLSKSELLDSLADIREDIETRMSALTDEQEDEDDEAEFDDEDDD